MFKTPGTITHYFQCLLLLRGTTHNGTLKTVQLYFNGDPKVVCIGRRIV